MIEEKLTKELGIEGEHEPLHLRWTGGSKRVENTSQRTEITKMHISTR